MCTGTDTVEKVEWKFSHRWWKSLLVETRCGEQNQRVAERRFYTKCARDNHEPYGHQASLASHCSGGVKDDGILGKYQDASWIWVVSQD